MTRPPLRPEAENDSLEVDLYLTSPSDADGEAEVSPDEASDDHDRTSAVNQVFDAPGHVATTASSEACAGGERAWSCSITLTGPRIFELTECTPEVRAEAHFDMAQNLYLNNSAASIVRDLKSRAWLFDLLVAHLAWLSRPEAQGGAGPGSVGPVTEARQGSISVRFDVQGQPPSATCICKPNMVPLIGRRFPRGAVCALSRRARHGQKSGRDDRPHFLSCLQVGRF